MSESYVECLVKQKRTLWSRLVKALLVLLAVASGIGMLFIPYLFIAVLVFGIGAYAFNMYTDLEYEYLYLDKELVIDKVMAKSKRKRVGTYAIDRIEILAPIKSYRLDNRRLTKVSTRVKDYSVGEELKPDRRYIMYYEGGEKILLNPSEEMIKIMKNAAPRRVFSD